MEEAKYNIDNIYEDENNTYLEIRNSDLINNKIDFIKKINKIIRINNYSYREEIKNDAKR